MLGTYDLSYQITLQNIDTDNHTIIDSAGTFTISNGQNDERIFTS